MSVVQGVLGWIRMSQGVHNSKKFTINMTVTVFRKVGLTHSYFFRYRVDEPSLAK